MTPEELEDWLFERPYGAKQAELLACRCAARAVAFYWLEAFDGSRPERARPIIPFLRAALFSLLALGSSPQQSKRWLIQIGSSSSRALRNISNRPSFGRDMARVAASAPVAMGRPEESISAASRLIADLVRSSPERSLDWWLSGDLDALQSEDWPQGYPLWSSEHDPPIQVGELAVGAAVRQDGPWDFWISWYKAILEGETYSQGLLGRLVVQPQLFWDGTDGEVNTRIAEIVAEWEAGPDDAEPDPDSEVRRLPPATQQQVQRTKSAMETYREDLPPTFDAVLGFVQLEIQRLQGKNYFPDDEAREENRRQIRVLTTLHQAVSRLKELVPVTPDMPQEDAEEAEKLGRLYVRLFKAWPRANAEELVDNVNRGALIGATTLALPMIGVATTAALAGGMIIFGGKKMIDAAKAAKDLWK